MVPPCVFPHLYGSPFVSSLILLVSFSLRFNSSWSVSGALIIECPCLLAVFTLRIFPKGSPLTFLSLLGCLVLSLILAASGGAGKYPTVFPNVVPFFAGPGRGFSLRASVVLPFHYEIILPSTGQAHRWPKMMSHIRSSTLTASP